MARKMEKAKYTLTIDVMMSGDIEVEAVTPKEAIQIAEKIKFIPTDLKDFHQTHSKVFEVKSVSKSES